MGEFMRVASQMTPEVQQMMFQGVKSLAPKAAEPSLMSIAIEGAKSHSSYGYVGLAVFSALAYYLKGGEYLPLKELTQDVKELNSKVGKMEIPEERLRSFENSRREEIARLEEMIVQLRQQSHQFNERRGEYIQEIEELKGFLETLNGRVLDQIETVRQVMGELETRLQRAREFQQGLSEGDRQSLRVYEETVKKEEEFGNLLRGVIEQFSSTRVDG